MSRPRIQTQHSSFSDELTVHPWDRLKDRLLDQLCDEDFETIVQLSRDRLGKSFHNVSSKPNHEYFNILENCNGKDVAVKFLENLVGNINFHGEQGALNYKKVLQTYREEKRLYEATKEFGFVGRSEERTLILDFFLSERIKVVEISGDPGIGKTKLALLICRILKDENWKIMKIDTRFMTDLGELIMAILKKLGEELDFEDLFLQRGGLSDYSRQLTSAIVALSDNQFKYLILLDDLDGVFTNEKEIQCFYRMILSCVKHVHNVKILTTTSKRLSVTDKECMNSDGTLMAKVQLRPLFVNETMEFLQKKSFESEQLSDTEWQRIHKVCDGSGLAMAVAGVLLMSNSSDILNGNTESLFDILFHEQMVALQMLLVCLTVFDTNTFDVTSATVVAPCNWKNKVEESLNKLSDQCLLERDQLSGNNKQLITGEISQPMFSIHSVVLEFLCLKCSKDKNLAMEKETAIKRFLEYMCLEITAGKNKQNDTIAKLKRNLDFKTAHLKIFFRLVHQHAESVIDVLPEDLKRIYSIRSLRLAADFVIFPLSALQTFVKQEEQVMWNKGDKYLFAYWKTVEADLLLEAGQIDSAERVMTELYRECNTDPKTFWSIVEKDREKQVICFCVKFVEARLKYHIGKQKKCINDLKEACEKIDETKTVFKKMKRHRFQEDDQISIANLKGCILYEMGDFEDAKVHHEAMIRKMKSDKKEHFNVRFIEYKTNLAMANFQLALQSKDKRDDLLDDALKEYGVCIDRYVNAHNDQSPNYAVLLQNQAEMYHAREGLNEHLEKALKSGRNALDLTRYLFRENALPVTELIKSLEKVAGYLFKLSLKGMQDKNSGKVLDVLQLTLTRSDLAGNECSFACL